MIKPMINPKINFVYKYLPEYYHLMPENWDPSVENIHIPKKHLGKKLHPANKYGALLFYSIVLYIKVQYNTVEYITIQ